ncbi:TIGR02587 family membrane protein [Nannocystis pusilla]|uniref:TIGR02587 family membrane protein n=1 Tax=Nannocystis pusilla TaxID=889268 RepID=A0ABS7TLY9_9BACT|nr:TIGR02587 family membrane protein [Nannocystis pusilla]MBZ5709211.1 TIGR02587 family membrane protein [Nannocystis pusilla]
MGASAADDSGHTRPRRAPAVARSLQEYGRGVAGGLLFSLPLLYTGELWRAGEALRPDRLLLGLAGVFILLLGYNRHAGLRADAGALEVVIDSIEELGLGLVLAAVLLVLLGRIDLAMPASEVLGKVLVGGLAVAIGVSVGTAQLGAGGDDDCGMSGEREDPSFVGQMALALCGAVLVAANIAPTEEIPEIGGALREWALLGLTALTLGVGALVLHFSDFVNTSAPGRPRVDVLVGSLASYVAAMAASAALLWFFGRFDGCDLDACLAQVVVLGLPTAIGASAGRLLLQPR